MRKLVGFLLWSVSALLLSCGPPQLPTGPRVTPPSSGEGSKYQCKDVTGSTDPWLVEWDPTAKVRLQSKAKKGVLLVKYSGCNLEVLYGCEVKGQYEFTATTRSSQTEYINNEDELFAKLPIGALNLAAEFKQGDRWALDYVVVGTQDANVNQIKRADLSGRCAEATHFVQGMAVGAYQLGAQAHRKGGAEATLYGVGAGGSKGSAAGNLRQDGRYEKCVNEETDATDQGCQAVVQLYLEPLSEGVSGSSSTPRPPAGKAKSSYYDTLGSGSSEGPPAPALASDSKRYKSDMEKAWAATKKVARKANTEDKLEMYQRFLSDFPVDNPYAKKARAQVEKLDVKMEKELKAAAKAAEKAAKTSAQKSRASEIRRAYESANNIAGSTSDKLFAWVHFAQAYPESDHPYLKTAKRKIESLTAQVESEKIDAEKAVADEDWKRKEAAGYKEVKQPGTNLYWLRCPLGQTWNDSTCSGRKRTMNWEVAKQACPSGYRLPTRQEFVNLLGGCDSDVRSGEYGYCKKCSESANCSKMFTSDTNYYWSSSPSGYNRAWDAGFRNGRVFKFYADSDRSVRCVR